MSVSVLIVFLLFIPTFATGSNVCQDRLSLEDKLALSPKVAKAKLTRINSLRNSILVKYKLKKNLKSSVDHSRFYVRYPRDCFNHSSIKRKQSYLVFVDDVSEKFKAFDGYASPHIWTRSSRRIARKMLCTDCCKLKIASTAKKTIF